MNLTRESLLDCVGKHTDLGHQKRNAAFVRQVGLACSSPATSLAQAAGRGSNSPMADLMSLYRFADNDNAPVSELRKTRAQVVLESIAPDKKLLVIHDVTLLDYTHQNAKLDRRRIGDHQGAGYEYFPCLAVDPDTGQVMGVVHDTLVSARGPDDRDVMDYDYEPRFRELSARERQRLRDNHRHQMAVHIEGLSEVLKNRRAIHVADCEFDDIFILGCCENHDTDFVIRTSANRNVQVPNQAWIPPEAHTPKQSGHALETDWVCVNLERLIEHVPLQPYKVLPLDARSRVTDPASAVRSVNLSIGACRVRLYRDAMRNRQYFRTPRPVDVSMVVIREPVAPAGVEPLCWVLFTSMPVDTLQHLAYIGRCYELRWKIEDFFRLLKSGYRIESSRLDSAEKTAKVLVVISLAAMVVLNLKRAAGLPSSGRLSPDDHHRIKNAMSQLDNPDIPIALRLLALVAKLGAWRARKTDPLGPAILMRGTLLLLSTFDILTQHSSLIQEVRRHPKILDHLFAYTC
jgi:DDE family transposase